MKVTLTQFVKGLGAPGAVVDTSPGYARNFLLPRKMAVLGEQRLTSGTATVVPATSAASQLQRLEQHSIVFSGAADEHTQTLYAGVGPQQIITEVKKQTGIEVSGSNFREFHALKKIGTHLVKARLHGQDFTIRCIIKSHHAKD